MRPFSVYPATFDGSTLGWWRFGERGGSLVDLVNAKVLTNTGAAALDDGYKFVASEADHMLATFASEPARAKWTAEGWLRGYGPLDFTDAYLFVYYESAGWNPRITLKVTGRPPGVGASLINAVYRGPAGVVADIQWSSVDFSAILAGPDWWHWAVVLDSDGDQTFRLFVNGVLRASAGAATALPANNYILRLGRQMSAMNYLSGVLDEVRLSASARYAANFSIGRFQDGRRAAARGPGLAVMAGAIP